MNARVVACCIACTIGAAGSHAKEEAMIEEVVVRAAPLSRSADEMTQPARVLGGDELVRKAQQSIGETLANELGASSSYFGPVASRPVIRGQGGPRLSVREDGVSSLDVSDLSPDHAVAIEPLLAERIEVIRGPGTLLYGSSAAGGVVNVVDRRVPEAVEPFGAALELRGDTASNERAVVARADGGTGSFAWHLDGFDRDSNDVDIPGYATDDPAERPAEEQRGRLANSFGNSSGYAAGGALADRAGYLGVAVSRYENDYGLPGPGEGDEAGGPFIELEQDRIDLRGGYDLDGAIEAMRLQAGYNDYRHTEFEPGGAPATRFDNEAWEARFEAIHAPIGGFRGAIGVQVGDRAFEAIGEEVFNPPTDTRTAALFLVEEREWENVRVELGARIETLEHDVDSTLDDYDAEGYSVAAGFVWDFAPGYDLSTNFSFADRLPAAEELYADGPHLASGLYEVGLFAQGLGVDEELARNIDVSVHHHHERREWRVSLFYNDIADYIYLQETDVILDGLPVALYTQDDAQFYGFEAEFMTVLATGALGDLNLRLFADYVRAETDSGDLPRIQPPRIGAELRLERSRWHAGIEAIYHAEQDDVSSFPTDAFTMVNADALYEFGDDGAFAWQVFARATNLLDEEARRSTSVRAAFVPLPGRSLVVGVRALIQ